MVTEMSELGWIVLIILLIIIAAIMISILVDSKRFVKAEYTIFSKKLKKNSKIVLLSDLHNKSFGENNKKLIEAIEEANPDFIVIAGDMMTSNGEKTQYNVPVKLLRHLASKYPVYYGNGNHEYRMKVYKKVYGDKYHKYKNELISCGVCFLENERVYLPETNIELFGLEIERYYYKRFYRRPMEEGYIKSKIGKSNDNHFELLIAHNPDYFDKYAQWGADLTVSGHVHGGVMKLPVLGGVVSPMMRFFPKYDGGLFKENEKQMILSRGLGMHTIPIRVFNPGELVIIHLKQD